MLICRPYVISIGGDDCLHSATTLRTIVYFSNIVLNKPRRWLVAIGKNDQNYFTINRLGQIKLLDDQTIQKWKNRQSRASEDKCALLERLDRRSEQRKSFKEMDKMAADFFNQCNEKSKS